MATAQQNHHTALWLVGAGGAAFIGYEFVYKPWAAAQAAAAAGATSYSPLPITGALSSPTSLVPSTTSGQQGSIIDPRVTPGGDVGQAMWRKSWTQDQATQRLNAIKTGVANSRAAIAQLQSNTSNPAAAGIPAAQAQLAQTQAALATARTTLAQAQAAGDANSAASASAAIADHLSDINDLTQRIAAAQKPVDNTAAIAQYNATISGLLSDYNALTGMNYTG